LADEVVGWLACDQGMEEVDGKGKTNLMR
jgi:hypothetical protein